MIWTRCLLTLTVVLAFAAAPLLRWPPTTALADAEGLRTEPRAYTFAAFADGRTAARSAALSNENERHDRDERRDRDDDDDDNDFDDLLPGGPPTHEITTPQQPPDRAGGCLRAGESVALDGPGWSAAVRASQDTTEIHLGRVDPAGVSLPPGGIVAGAIFRLDGAPCGGAAGPTLPSEVNLGVRYDPGLLGGRDARSLVLLREEGGRWAAAPRSVADPSAPYVSASVSQPGIYALGQP